MADLKEKAKKRGGNQMGPGVARLVQRYVATEGVSRSAALSALVGKGKLKKVNGSYQVK
jgi:hypothetical protein